MTNEGLRMIHGMTDCIRATVRIAERELNDWISRLEHIPGCGYSSETLAMIRLQADADTLRDLAHRIQNIHDRLTKPEPKATERN